MYKVLIVDDEPLARIGLKETVNWVQYGFEIAADADNATTAMELCRKLQPDVVITDICMEPISGLELIENLQKENLFPEIIVISGYSDFAYAQTAIKFGVSTYILKPVEDEDLTDALKKLKEKLDKKRKTTMALTEYTLIQKEKHLAELLTADSKIQNTYQRVYDEGFRFPEDLPYVASVMRIVSPGMEPVKPQQLISALNKAAKSQIDSSECSAMSTILNNGLVVVILFDSERDKAEQIIRWISGDFSSQNRVSVKTGISNTARGISALPQTFAQAYNALKRGPVPDPGKMIPLKPMDEKGKTDIFLFQEKNRELTEAIILRNQERVSDIVETYFHEIRGMKQEHIAEIKNTVANTAVYILSHYLKTPEMMQLVFHRNVQPTSEVWKMESVDDILQWLADFVDTLMKSRISKELASYSPLVQNTIHYIMTNYAKNCDIDEISKHFFVSSGHLMRQFKQETGKTMLEYLTEHRIAVATVLLESRRYKIYEVGEMVGYPNTKYFRKIFQKITGKSPKDFMN